MDWLKTANLPGPTAMLALGLITVVLIMILPVPRWVLDVGLTASFAFAILIFVTAVFIEKPLDFSSFPSVLLASLILRLALNVSSTKLIIGEGHTGTAAAGGVIEGFAMFIMGGNLFVGLVVFAVLVIVNFMVITKGAGRMAEVGARFALDAMPGKQLAIDSDLAVGAITHEQAKQMRQQEQEEAAFLGSLDGASKFVKGDAVAGLLITALNLVAGIGFGLLAHGLSFGQAMANYSILTVGDGLVTQIPAVIVSVSAALLLSKGREDGAIDTQLAAQLGARPAPLIIVGGLLALMAVMPGLPLVPFALAAAGFGALAWHLHRAAEAADAAAKADVAAGAVADAAGPPRLGDAIFSDEIHLEVAPDLVSTVLVGESGMESRIDRVRRYIAEEYGFILPPIRMTDDPALETNAYALRIQGVRVERGLLRPGSVMALMEEGQLPHLAGEAVREPVYKAEARWLDANARGELSAAGIAAVEPVEVLATHLLEVIQANFGLIFNRGVLLATLDAITEVSDSDRAAANRRFLDEYIPAKVTNEQLLQVLRLLLEERVSVRNLLLIIETMAEAKPLALPPAQLAERVRQRLAFQITDRLRDNEGRLPLVQLSGEWEQRIGDHEVGGGEAGPGDIALPPELFGQLASNVQAKLNEAAGKGVSAAVATSARRRRFLKAVLGSKGLRNAVLAYEEIDAKSQPYIVGVV